MSVNQIMKSKSFFSKTEVTGYKKAKYYLAD
jgi:hypothetical protein